jgi:mRNA interferase MazF
MNIKKYDIVNVDLLDAKGSEQGGIRPCVIISNNKHNLHAPTVTIVTLTTAAKKLYLPTHEMLYKNEAVGLPADSVIEGEQIRTVDKRRIKEKWGYISSDKAKEKCSRAYLAQMDD